MVGQRKRLRVLLLVSLAVLPWRAAQADSIEYREVRYGFSPTLPFGATHVDEVVLRGYEHDAYLVEEGSVRQAFLDHLFVTGPDGQPVDYVVELATDLTAMHLPDVLRLTGLPDGWNTLWIYKRRDVPVSNGGVVPKLFELQQLDWGAELYGWLETEAYWRLDYLVGRSEPGLSWVSDRWYPEQRSSVTLQWSEPVTLRTDDITGTVVLLDAEGPMTCTSAGTGANGWSYDAECEGIPLEALELAVQPEGRETGIEASYPAVGETAYLADWQTFDPPWGGSGTTRFAIRREPVEAPAVSLPELVLPAAPDYDSDGCACGVEGAGGWLPGLLVFGLLWWRRGRAS